MKRIYLAFALIYIATFAAFTIVAVLTGHTILGIISASFALYKAGFGKWLLNKFTLPD